MIAIRALSITTQLIEPMIHKKTMFSIKKKSNIK